MPHVAADPAIHAVDVQPQIGNAAAPMTTIDATDPAGDTGGDRVLRGGSWAEQARLVRSAHRRRSAARARSSSLGFRVARTMP